jgi:hypothetical protein
VDDWEKQHEGSDPDYAKKAALVETTCRAIVPAKREAARTRRSGALAEAGLSG